jgi:hypothetical protein
MALTDTFIFVSVAVRNGYQLLLCIAGQRFVDTWKRVVVVDE